MDCSRCHKGIDPTEAHIVYNRHIEQLTRRRYWWQRRVIVVLDAVDMDHRHVECDPRMSVF